MLALTLYGILPVLRNTIVGLAGRRPDAGRGRPRHGHVRLAVLLRIELPLAVPVIMAGVRTALVLLVGTATLATFINAGGLGSLITTGITLFRYPRDRRRRRAGRPAGPAHRVARAGCSS